MATGRLEALIVTTENSGDGGGGDGWKVSGDPDSRYANGVTCVEFVFTFLI